ncbi:hypothetical protein KKG71_00450 [Patescibacteria group bacterium]|nr:hypothetical protein [Patescibacteria group bacterium]
MDSNDSVYSDKDINVLREVVQILKNTAKKFGTFDYEGEVALSKGDLKPFKKKQLAKAGVIVELPSKLENVIGGLPDELKQEIQSEVRGFAVEAQKYINGHSFLGVGLSLMGDEVNDKNDLEMLIDRIMFLGNIDQ